MCKLHNEVFETAESRINIECLPLARGDESAKELEELGAIKSAPRKRG